MEREFYYSKDGTKVMVVAPIGELEPIIERMDRFKYRYDHMLVIGNGFDLNLGLHTTYRSFVESCIFKKMYVNRIQEKRKIEKQNKTKATPSLIDYLYGKKFYERWYDIEQALLEYVTKKPDGGFANNVEEDKEDYELVCKALIDYLVSLFKTGNDLKQSEDMAKSSAGKLLKCFCSERNVIYSFNYTPINLIISNVIGYRSKMSPIRIHGEIEEESIFRGNIHDNSIVLGIETSNINDIAPRYSFLFKSNNPAYRSSNIASDLINTRNVIFFGHSLNQMDFGYFEGYFKLLTTNAGEGRILTLITKDENSRVALLDNLRRAGVSVRDLFAHTNVEIILTDDIGKEGTESNMHFNKLLDRIENKRYNS